MQRAGRGVIAAPLPVMAGGILDALREGRRYIVHSDEPLSAFLELERVTIGQYEPPQIRLKCLRSVRSRSRNDTKS